MPLPKRNCILREEDHRYIWDPFGTPEVMRVSVTGVTGYFDNVDYSRFPEAAPRGTHVHRAAEALAWDNITLRECQRQDAAGNEEAWEASPDSFLQFMDDDGHLSPEGIDCSRWIETLQGGKLYRLDHTPVPGDRDMASFWQDIDVIDSEYVCVDRRKSLGGCFDLLFKSAQGTTLLDFKSKSDSWTGPKKTDLKSYSAQAGGYLALLQTGDGAVQPAPWVDICKTLIITPSRAYFLPPMDPNQCSLDFEACWDAYEAAALALPF